MLKEDLPDEDFTVPIGPAQLRREGDDITVISYGLMAHECLQAAEELAADGIESTVLDLRTLAPLDRTAILEAAQRTGKILIVHEDNLTGGLGAEIAAIIAEHAFDSLDAPIRRLASPDVPAMPFAEAQEEFCLPSREKIAAAMRELAAY
jgi:2-oxoisovalerate dehydrogenase E1 component beta subunit